MEDFPKGDAHIQQADTRDGAPNPSRGHNRLQSIETSLTRSVQQEIVVSPLAQSESALRNPGKQCEHNPDLKAEDDVENDA